MRRAHVPVSMGAAWCRTIVVPLGSVTEARFPPGAVLDAHTHGRAVFGVMLRGSFDTLIAARTLACDEWSSWVEPREEKHRNAVGARGAWVIVVQPDPARAEELDPLATFFDSIVLDRNPEVLSHAHRVAAEIAAPDSLTTLAIESALLAMLTSAARLRLIHERRRGLPPWLRQARDLVHETFRGAPGLAEIAGTVGVEPTRLAHAFRQHYGASMGSYARELRLTWALDRIVASNDPLAAVAAQAGFSDQSHMNRACKARTGLSPGQLRLRRRAF